MACALAGCNASVAILDHLPEQAERFSPRIKHTGGSSMTVGCDVLQRESLELAAETILAKWGKIDCLVNAAGGNNPATRGERSFSTTESATGLSRS
jgi:NAD(P)-dependent dehydrogenase (short-subunit alcohol dehydrogenase family)